MNALQSRKQLLVAESELNRAHLAHEFQAIRSEAQAFASQAGSTIAIASAVASLVAGLASFRRQKAESAAAKPSRWQTLAKVAGMVSSLWRAFRTPPKSERE
jgi:hypothetical protein